MAAGLAKNVDHEQKTLKLCIKKHNQRQTMYKLNKTKQYKPDINLRHLL